MRSELNRSELCSTRVSSGVSNLFHATWRVGGHRQLVCLDVALRYLKNTGITSPMMEYREGHSEEKNDVCCLFYDGKAFESKWTRVSRPCRRCLMCREFFTVMLACCSPWRLTVQLLTPGKQMTRIVGTKRKRRPNKCVWNVILGPRLTSFGSHF